MHYLGATSKMTEWSWFFPRQAIQHDSNSSLCPYYRCQRSCSWSVLWRPRKPPRTNTKMRCSIHQWGLVCQRRKSRNTWSDRQVWPWRTKWSREKAEFCQENALIRANTLSKQHKRQVYSLTSPNGQYWNQIDYIFCSQRWRSCMQSEKSKTWSWLWLYSSASHSKIHA